MSKKRKVRHVKKATVAVTPTPVAVVNPFGPTEHRQIKSSHIATSTFTLNDGTKFLVTPVVGDIRRAVGQFNENGEPLYFLTVGQSIKTNAPKRLLRPKAK